MLVLEIKKYYDIVECINTIEKNDFNAPFAPELKILRANVYNTRRTYDTLLVTIYSRQEMTCNGNVRMSDLFNIYLDKTKNLVVKAVRPDMPNDVEANWYSPSFVHFESKTTGIWFQAHNGLNNELRNMIYMERLNM